MRFSIKLTDHKLLDQVYGVEPLRSRQRTSGARDQHGPRSSTKPDHDIAANIWTKIPTIVDLCSAGGETIIDDFIDKAEGAAIATRSTQTAIRHKPAKPRSTWASIVNPPETDGRGDQGRSTLIPELQVGEF